MTKTYLHQLLLLLKRLSIAYFLYFLCRILFFVANKTYFSEVGFFDLIKDCFYGLRFDSFSIVVSNSLFILLSILPINAFFHKAYQSLLLWLFVIGNTVFLAANSIDVAYYPFIKKRASADLFEQLGGQSDMGKLIPEFLKDFWWALLCFIGFIFLLVLLYKRIRLQINNRYSLKPAKAWLSIGLLFVLSTGFSVLAVRGGLQRVPIDIVNAGSMTNPAEVPIVLNTPFTLIKSVSQSAVQDYHFFTEKELKTLYDPIWQFKDSSFKKQNVVVLILESFSKEYTKLSRNRSFTPFLDSLMNQSLVFSNAFSNGTKSIEGIPAILSSLPSLMENPFINSIYANNNQSSFASILKKEGYETAFFHGGINGTMNFDDWAALAGYEQYYGRNEYNNEKDFDGFWGIMDEPFLQYSVKQMSAMKAPFHTAVFTLSSHHPYYVPEKYKNKFPKGQLENAQSIGYADYSLNLFFEAAKKTDWYKNTLFILTADHASISESNFYGNIVGNLTIPILFFKPDNSLKGINDQVFSQIDILPSALNLLGYNKSFFAFGEPFGKTMKGHDYFYQNGTHYSYSDSLVFCYNLPKLGKVFNYRRDSDLVTDVASSIPDLDSLNSRKFRAFIQTYNNTLIHNSGSVK